MYVIQFSYPILISARVTHYVETWIAVVSTVSKSINLVGSETLEQLGIFQEEEFYYLQQIPSSI